jgi:hypothetical protein
MDDTNGAIADLVGGNVGSTSGAFNLRVNGALYPTQTGQFAFNSGSSGQMQVFGIAAYDVTAGGDATLEAWIRLPSPCAVGSEILSVQGSAGDPPFISIACQSGGDAQWTLHDNGGSGVQTPVSGIKLDDGGWKHVVLVKQGGSGAFYVNGVQVSSNGTSFGSSFTISGGGFIQTNRPNTDFDEIAYYVGRALTSTDVSAHYHAAGY